MCVPQPIEWTPPASRDNATARREFDRLIVLDGNVDCPAPELCEPNYAAGETYETYVRRHAVDHAIFIDAEFHHIERNLFLYCLHAFHKFCLENDAITPWPFWEDHAFLSKWDWNDDDLEMNVGRRSDRRYRLPPVTKRRAGTFKRQKQLEKPRETMKTAEGFAFATWRHLRAFYIEDTANLRITVHSSTTKLTRKRYINQAFKVWGRRSGKLFDLFGGTETYGPETRKMTRRIGLVHTRGAINRIDNTIALRWLQDDERSFATHSMMGLGAESESTGERADIYIGDDVCTADNSRTLEMRMEVKRKVAEQEKQLEHGGLWLWIDTRKHINDVAGDNFVKPNIDYFHILHRRASWICPDCGEVQYYWPLDGTGKARITEEWLQEQRRKHSERDFWNELFNEPQDPDKQTFKREWFEITPLSRAVPLEVRCGLGLLTDAISASQYEDELARLDAEGSRVFAINLGDPAGREKASKHGDRTAIVGLRLDRSSGIWITYLRSGQWGAQQQKEEAYASVLYNKPRVFIWEIVQDSGVEKAWQDFATEKGRETNNPVMLPMKFVKPKRTVTKQQRIEELEPYFRRGVHILETAGAIAEIELFIAQFLEYLVSDHDDYPDATANAIDYLKALPAPREAAKSDEPIITVNEAGNPLVTLAHLINKKLSNVSSWGRSGGMN